MSRRLEGRVAVVTGGSRGIGKAIAGAFAAEGATVVIGSRKPESLAATAAELDAAHPGAVICRPLHVGHVDDIGPWWDAVQDVVGAPDVLVNNAGTNPYFGPMLGTEWAAWDKTFEVNLRGPFEMTRQLVTRHLASAAPGSPASIIQLSSILGLSSAPLQGVYGMTKAALVSMTQTLARELGPRGVRINAIAPGVVDTRLAAAITNDDSIRESVVGHTALRRIARPEEIAGMAVFLASEESSYVTGQTLPVDGGYLVC